MRNLKKVLALVLAMAMSLSLAVTAGAAFKDGDKIADKYATAVEFAAQTGILEGFEDGSYGPQKNLTRAQLATMTYRIATGDVEDAYTADFAGGAAAAFTDTAADAWYAGYVGYAADAGYLKGVGDGLYKPNSAMTGYQALAAFLRVVGYNQPGQFTGADWTVQVAQVAYEIGALEGITGVDLNAAISREVAAQMIFNILFSDIVSYTPAFGYQNALFQDTLVEDVFGIEPVSYDEPTAPWGQPATQWHYNDVERDVAVSIPFAPVAEYTVAVNECDLAKDLGVTEEVVTDWYINGDAQEKFDDVITIEHDATIGAQGTLTEVYEVGDAYWFVQVETWLGQIVDTTEAKTDKNGHEVDPATAELVIFAEDKASVVLETADYAEDDYVLVNYSFMEDEFYLTKTAPVATAEQTYIDIAKEFSTIGGKDYDWAAKYFLGKTGLVKTEYNVFVDFYGNLIGLTEIPEADPVYAILQSGIHVTNGYDPYTAGKVVNTETGALEDITICDYAEVDFWADRYVTYVRDIVEYVECEDGYEMTQAGTEYDGFSVKQGTPRILALGEDVTLVTDANTVYAVETETDVYDIYVGYTNVPTMISAGELEVLDEDNDGYVDLVLMDARNALFAGEEYFAYVMTTTESVAVGNLDNGKVFKTFADVVINGEVVEVYCAPGFDMTTFAGDIVTLKTDADGLVYAADPAVGADFTEYTVAKDNSEEVIYVLDEGNEKSYVVTDETIIWVVDEAEGTVVAGTADDVVEGTVIDLKVSTDPYADFIIVYA